MHAQINYKKENPKISLHFSIKCFQKPLHCLHKHPHTCTCKRRMPNLTENPPPSPNGKEEAKKHHSIARKVKRHHFRKSAAGHLTLAHRSDNSAYFELEAAKMIAPERFILAGAGRFIFLELALDLSTRPRSFREPRSMLSRARGSARVTL